MGIMHKLLQRRDLECEGSIMDLTKSKDTFNKCTNQMQVSEIQEHDLVPKLATDDNQFTAEHIVQLCKFLAEKSKRNKMVYKRSSPNSHSPSKLKLRAQCQRESNPMQETIETVNHVPYSRLHDNDECVMATSASTINILGNKRITDSNVCEDLSLKNISATNKQNCAQEKRDILLKIRHQIFERKRQRQLIEQQLDVWRPW